MSQPQTAKQPDREHPDQVSAELQNILNNPAAEPEMKQKPCPRRGLPAEEWFESMGRQSLNAGSSRLTAAPDEAQYVQRLKIAVLGAKLRYGRHTQGISQRELAQKAKLSISRLQQIEKGQAALSLRELERLAHLLEQDKSWLWPHSAPPGASSEALGGKTPGRGLVPGGEACGRNLRRCRVQAHLTQRELAHKAGCAATDISRYERGLTRPGASRSRALAKAMGITTDELFTKGGRTSSAVRKPAKPCQKPTTVGLLIKQQRKLQGLTQAELAQRALLPAYLVGSYERGMLTPSDATLQTLAQALGVDALELSPVTGATSTQAALSAGERAAVRQNIRLGRKRLKLTQAQFAQQLGVSQGLARAWEVSDIEPTAAELDAVVHVLGLTLQQLKDPDLPAVMAAKAKNTPTRTAVFAQNLARYRQAAGLTQRGLADLIGSTAVMISFYECGRSYPKPPRLAELAAALGVQPKDLKTAPPAQDPPLDPLAVNLRIYRAAAGLSQQELGRRIGVTGRTIATYEQGVAKPEQERLSALADALEVPQDLLAKTA